MIECKRCGRTGESPPAHRFAFMGADKERIATTICQDCWKEWESMEVKVINEQRLNFMDPGHRDIIKRACADFFQFSSEA